MKKFTLLALGALLAAGSASAAGDAFTVTATMGEVGLKTAEVNYAVNLPDELEGAAVKVYVGYKQASAASYKYVEQTDLNGTVTLENLVKGTAYDVDVYARAIPAGGSVTDLWAAATLNTSWYYGPGWAEVPGGPAMTVEDGAYTFTLDQGAWERWQAQLFFNNNIVTTEGRTYDIMFDIVANKNVDNMLCKWENGMFDVSGLAVTANEKKHFEFNEIAGKNSNGIRFLYDFAPCEAGTTFTLSDIKILEHNDAEPLFTDHVSTTFTTEDDGVEEPCPVWYQHFDGTSTQYGNTYNISVDYNVTYNADKTLTVYAEFNGTDGIVGLANRQISFVRGIIEEWAYMTADGDGWTFNTTKTAEEGTEVEFFFWLPYAEGVFGGNYHQIYVAGSANEAPVTAPRISAEAQNVTYNSAEISYDLTIPASLAAADVKVYYVEKDANMIPVEATANPIVLSDLNERTNYTYEVYAVAILGEDTYESTHAQVSFKTPSQDAVDLVYSDYAKATIKNAYLVGEEASMARTFYVSLPWSVTYTADGRGIYKVDLSQIANVVGLTPQIYWNGFKALTPGEDNVWSYDFGEQTAEAKVEISHYFAYAGGVYDFRTAYTAWGMEQEMPEIGDAAQLSLSVGTHNIQINKPFTISACVADANGYYISDDAVEYTIPEGMTLANGLATVTEKGNYTLVANIDALSASANIYCTISENATNLSKGVIAYSYDDLAYGDVANVTDDNDQSQIEWSCADTQIHYIFFDLGKEYAVESINLVWEGAYATAYDIILSKAELPATPAAAPARVITEDHVINVTNNTTHTVHPVLNAENEHDAAHARYVGITTSAALNTGWGIKLRQVRVYGTDAADVSGVENVATASQDGTVNVYNLQGVCVMRNVDAASATDALAPGFYIVGGKKVLVK